MRDVADDFMPGMDPEKSAYRAAFPPHQCPAGHLRESLRLATGLTDLIADDADVREAHGESLFPSNTEAAARAANLILRIASIQAEALARQRDAACRQATPPAVIPAHGSGWTPATPATLTEGKSS